MLIIGCLIPSISLEHLPVHWAHIVSEVGS
jgi:hypothetical protein